MQKIVMLILPILFLIFHYAEPCCDSGWIVPPPPVCCCCCCCNYGWGYNSGWPPQAGCAGGYPYRRRGMRVMARTRAPILADIPWNEAVPRVKELHKKDAKPKFLATIATVTEQPVCTGTIISAHFVLSSCVRCLHDNGTAVNPDKVRVMVVDDLPGKKNHFIIYETRSVMLHPECVHDGKYNLKHDVGLVQTVDKIKESLNVKPAKLPSKKKYPPNASKYWTLAAYSAEKGVVSKVKDAIAVVKVPTVEPETCKRVLNSTYYNSTYNYCTPYYHDGRSDYCEDDFGAALSMDDTLFGLLIHKFACGKPGSAGSFVSVPYNIKWIKKVVHLLSNGTETV